MKGHCLIAFRNLSMHYCVRIITECSGSVRTVAICSGAVDGMHIVLLSTAGVIVRASGTSNCRLKSVDSKYAM